MYESALRTLPDRMQAVVLLAEYAPRTPALPGAMGCFRNVRVRLSNQPTPQPGRGEVLLGVQYVGVCGSDIHAVRSDAEGYSSSSVPAADWHQPGGLRLGHEYTAIVRDIGPGVRPSWLGRWVTGDSLLPCRRCAICRAGQRNHCRKARLIGLERNGVFGEYAVVPATSLHALDPLREAVGEAALELGALAEPLGVAANALKAGLDSLPRRYPRTVLIRGGGPIGLLTALVARALRFDPIVIAEPNPLRQAVADRLGFDTQSPVELSERACRSRFGPGAAVIVDACGLASATELLTGIRPGGVVVSIARTGAQSSWPDDWMITNGIRRVCTRGHVGFLPWVLRCMASGRIDPRPLVTRCLQSLDELCDWLQHPDRFAGEGKVLCRVNN
jgi:threonine dehydrogenase-like Zn-dependent dehydrogenase